MKLKISIGIIFLTGSIPFLSFSQNPGTANSNSYAEHQYLEYTFQLAAGLNTPADAERADQLMKSLKDMVVVSTTDFNTHIIRVSVYDARVTFESLVYVLELNGFKASDLISKKNEDHK